jgi:hypothetical protein
MVEIEVGVTNPTNKRIKAIATIESGKSDWYNSWSEIDLGSDEHKFFTIKAEYGQSVFPLPKSNLKIVDGKKELFGWEDFFKQAFIKVVPKVVPEDVLGDVPNPGFEEGTNDSWGTWAGSLVSSDATAHSGSYSGYVSERTNSWQGPVRDLIYTLKDGHTYQVSIWVKLDNADNAYARMTVQQTDGSGTHYHVINEATIYNDKWVKVSGAFTPEITGYLEALSLYVEGPAEGVNFYVDDLEIKWDPLGQ